MFSLHQSWLVADKDNTYANVDHIILFSKWFHCIKISCSRFLQLSSIVVANGIFSSGQNVKLIFLWLIINPIPYILCWQWAQTDLGRRGPYGWFLMVISSTVSHGDKCSPDISLTRAAFDGSQKLPTTSDKSTFHLDSLPLCRCLDTEVPLRRVYRHLHVWIHWRIGMKTEADVCWVMGAGLWDNITFWFIAWVGLSQWHRLESTPGCTMHVTTWNNSAKLQAQLIFIKKEHTVI